MFDTESSNPDASVNNLSARDINTLRLLYKLDPDVSNFAPGEKQRKFGKKTTPSSVTKIKMYKKYDEAMDYVKKYPDNALSWSSLGKCIFMVPNNTKKLLSATRKLFN